MVNKLNRYKPGPKSRTRSIIVQTRADLGDGSSGTDESRTDTSRVVRRSQVLDRSQQRFLTPDSSNVTDYGLEFTTSNIRNPSPRRCSTLRPKVNGTQSSQATGSNVRKSAAEATSRQTRSTNTPATANAGDTNVRKPRKQRNPASLEKRFWKEVRTLQQRTKFLIPMQPFSRLVREIMFDCSSEVTKVTRTAMEAMQLSVELYLTQRLEDAYMLTLHRGRVTLDVRDMQLINFLKSYL